MRLPLPIRVGNPCWAGSALGTPWLTARMSAAAERVHSVLRVGWFALTFERLRLIMKLFTRSLASRTSAGLGLTLCCTFALTLACSDDDVEVTPGNGGSAGTGGGAGSGGGA